MKFKLVGCIALAACGNHHATPATTATPLATAAPVAPASTADQDALWKLAPPGAKFGIVASPRGLALVEGGLETLEQRASATPDLAEEVSELRAVIREQIGTDKLDVDSIGWSRDRGFAAFMLDGSSRLMILPVANRERFLAVAGGTRGADSDTLHGMTCKTLRGLYVCGEPASVLDQLGQGELASHLQLVGSRGDVEFVGADAPLELAIVAQLSRGAMVVRGAARGLPADLTSLLDGHDAAVDTQGLAGFGIVDIVGKTRMPPIELAPGVRLDEVYAQVAAPLTVTVPGGGTSFEVHVPFKDTTLVQKLVEQCAVLPPLASAGASVKDGVCHIPFGNGSLALDAWIDGTELHLGQKGAPLRGKSISLGPIGEELSKGHWAIAFFGRGTMIGASQFSSPLGLGLRAGGDGKMMRAAVLLNELGFGLRKDGDTVRFLLANRTIFSNPEDVVTRLLAISPDDVVAGKTGAAATAIAAAAPGSPFAADLAGGPNGIVVSAAGVGLVAGVVIPALMDHLKKPEPRRKIEPIARLEDIAKSAKATYLRTGAFPTGAAGPSPDGSCCQPPNYKCHDPEAWRDPVWQSLEFQIDRPHLFRYAYASPDGKTAQAYAIGDLDCDGISVTYQLDLKAENGNPTATITEPAPNTD